MQGYGFRSKYGGIEVQVIQLVLAQSAFPVRHEVYGVLHAFRMLRLVS